MTARLTPDQIRDVLEKHSRWLAGNPKGTRADLTGVNLTRVNLAGVNLTLADLTGANLTEVNLTRANLTRANLTRANLTRVNLTEALLTEANLTGVKNAALVIAQTRILPEGDLIGWKKCNDGVIAKLLIPADAKRSHAFGRKCRAEYADVLAVYPTKAKVGITNHHGPETRYVPGERVTPDGWDDNWMEECSQGIHFFITRLEAEAW